MSKKLLLNPKTDKKVMNFVQKPSHALLITGPDGSGKKTIASYIASKLINISEYKLPNYPYFVAVEKQPGKQDISIDAVREVIKQLRLKPVISGVRSVNRVILIDGAQYLSTEAQNALLKMIEEPPENTVFILTATTDSAVLPTISSRTQKMAIGQVTWEMAKKYFKDEYKETEVKSAWNLSRGNCGLLVALLEDDKEHSLRKAVESAKKFLSSNRYERVLLMDKLSGDKAELDQILDALIRILAALHYSAINKGNLGQSKKLVAARKLTGATIDMLNTNISPRLAVLNLALKLPV